MNHTQDKALVIVARERSDVRNRIKSLYRFWRTRLLDQQTKTLNAQWNAGFISHRGKNLGRYLLYPVSFTFDTAVLDGIRVTAATFPISPLPAVILNNHNVIGRLVGTGVLHDDRELILVMQRRGKDEYRVLSEIPLVTSSSGNRIFNGVHSDFEFSVHNGCLTIHTSRINGAFLVEQSRHLNLEY